MKDPSVKMDADASLQSSLSTKISVIVFWGMIVIGLFASFSLLRGLEESISEMYSAHSNEYIHELEEYIDHDKNFSWENLQRLAQKQMAAYSIRGAVIRAGDRQILVGEQDARLMPLSHEFFYHMATDTHQRQGTVKVTAYFTPLDQAVAEKRKHILVFMGAMLLAFGLFLHRVLQKVLSQPFQRMMQTAKSITRGEVALRFEDNRTDEFGFLSRFINKALDFVTLKQQELQEALEKVRESEARLMAEKRSLK